MRHLGFFSGVLVVFLFAMAARADAVYPADTIRNQGNGLCWAYGTARVLESKSQSLTGVASMLDLERGIHYWQVYDRLMSVYHLRSSKIEDKITTTGGYAAELLEILRKHGLPLYMSAPAPRSSGYDYPTRIESNGFFGPPAEIARASDFREAIATLAAGQMSEAEASQFAIETLDRAFTEHPKTTTEWLKQIVPVIDVANYMLPGLFESGENPFVLVSKDKDSALHDWFIYDDGRYMGFHEDDPAAMLSLVRASLDHGWPATIETNDHVRAVIGYKTIGDKRFYAIADNKVFWESEAVVLKWVVGTTLYYPAIKDRLPQAPHASMRGLLVRSRITKKY